MKNIDPELLKDFVKDIFLALKLDNFSATLLADSLVQADLWGHSSHGVLRTSWYADRIRNKVMDPSSKPEIISDTGPLVLMDGHDGIGKTIVAKAVDLVGERARQFGIASASIRRSGHFGTAMYFTKMLAEQDLIGFLATNASPAIPPYGGIEKMVGNNPQSWAAPTNLAAPFIVDIAHTAVARGKIYLADEKNEKIPDNWALAPDGTPTTDPKQAILGTLLPMGGHKGAGLSAMMDILSGVLSGGSFGTQINGPYIPDKPSGVGHFILAIDISKLRSVDEFKSEMGEMIGLWKTSRLAQDTDEIFYPGEKEYLHELRARADGVALPSKTIDTLISYAASLGVKSGCIF